MSLDTSRSVTEPRQAHSLDADRLLAHLKLALPVLGNHPGQLRIQQFQHGQSNPTYMLQLDGSPRMVLRKQPPGRLLASAHAVDREYRALCALSKTAFPVPRPLCLCTDSSVIGTQFYVMEFADGTIFTDPNLPDAGPRDRKRIYSKLVDTLADLHSLQPASLGLQDFGIPNHYCRRQVSRWSKQYVASMPQPAPAVLQLIEWLQQHVPAQDAAPPAPALVHGDYRLDNLVFDQQLQVIAVLDWELATLGNPWADVAYLCMAYHLPPVLTQLCLKQPLPGGIPPAEALLQRYCSSRGLSLPSQTDWAFYMALSIFRLLSILAGVQARSRQGNASSSAAAAISSDAVLDALCSAAHGIIAGVSSSSSSVGMAAAAPAAGPLARAAAAGGAPGLAGPTAASHDSSSNSSGRGGGSGPPVPVVQHGTVSSNLHSSSPVLAGTVSSNFGSSSGGSGSSGRRRAGGLGAPSVRVQQLLRLLNQFMEQHVYPNEHVLEEHAGGPNRWTIHSLNEQLKQKAKAVGLWNLWMPAGLAAKLHHLLPMVPEAERPTLLGADLSHLEYAHLCAVMGSSLWAPEVFNCSAPDTGNMEVLAKYGTAEQQQTWLVPLLCGQIRSCFAMTEKAVASSDATNIQSEMTRSSDKYVVKGLKWWTSGAMDPRCKVAIFMGKTDLSAPTHRQQSMLLVPMDAPGVKVIRPLTVFGYDDAPHGHAEVSFDKVVVPASNLLLGEGRGFEIAQGRLGPGRLHHCMRLVGMAERALALASQRALQRVAFRRPLAAQGGLREVLARQRVALEGARLLVLNASEALDSVGHKAARGEIAAAKVAAPAVALQVIDAAIQIHGGAGVSQDVVLGHLYAAARTLRIADGPDEVHLGTLAKLELEAAAGGPAELKKILAGTGSVARPKF